VLYSSWEQRGSQTNSAIEKTREEHIQYRDFVKLSFSPLIVLDKAVCVVFSSCINRAAALLVVGAEGLEMGNERWKVAEPMAQPIQPRHQRNQTKGGTNEREL
jgi:hypothetical protein